MLSITFCRGNADIDYPDFACRSNVNFTEHNPPLLYDLWLDPGEMSPMDPYENYNLLVQIYEVCT